MGSRILCALVIVAAIGCSRRPEPSPASSATPKAPTWSGLDQGWSDDEKDQFWFTSQGSLLVPYPWFLVLEDADNETALRDDATLGGLGYLPAAPSARNPDGLPIGFVKDRHKTDDREMLGFTCAACHTTRLEWQGNTVQVEGGPALADFEGFLDALVGSLEATVKDPQKFERFSRKVVGEASGSKATALRTDLERFTADLLARDVRNHPPHPYGRGRVDALGNILNEVLAVDLGVAENARPADAPVSYPVMWDAHQHDFVQWNGSAPNAGPGPVLRNIGEVLGVFGHMQFTPRKDRFAVYKNASVDISDLKQLEILVEKLQSPLWPASFPAVDPEKAKAGQALHQAHCESCHPPIKRDDPNRRIKAHMVEVAQVGTDPVAAQNFVERKAKTGPLKGTPVFVDLRETFGDTASGGEILRNAVFGVQLGKFEQGLLQRGPVEVAPHGPALNERDDPGLLRWDPLESTCRHASLSIL